MRDLFDRWERVRHDGQYDLIPSCIGGNYIRHDETGEIVTRAGLQVYRIEAGKLAETWRMLMQPDSAWPDAVAQEQWTSPPPIK